MTMSTNSTAPARLLLLPLLRPWFCRCLCCGLFLTYYSQALSFSGGSTAGTSSSSSSSYNDRFRSVCPADRNCIYQFDPNIAKDYDEDHTWVAVYRSSNNSPSVFLKDDFVNAMNIATSNAATGTKTTSDNDNPKGRDTVRVQVPVAVARLRPSDDDDDDTTTATMIDTLRCSVKKEQQNADCDGGSEHTEALAVCIDELILRHLKFCRCKNILRAKATLLSAPLFEARGFRPVTTLSADMPTHDVSLRSDQHAADMMERYASRAVSTSGNDGAKSPGARERSLQILALLGQLEENGDESASDGDDQLPSSVEDEQEEYDPWASVKKYY